MHYVLTPCLTILRWNFVSRKKNARFILLLTISGGRVLVGCVFHFYLRRSSVILHDRCCLLIRLSYSAPYNAAGVRVCCELICSGKTTQGGFLAPLIQVSENNQLNIMIID